MLHPIICVCGRTTPWGSEIGRQCRAPPSSQGTWRKKLSVRTHALEETRKTRGKRQFTIPVFSGVASTGAPIPPRVQESGFARRAKIQIGFLSGSKGIARRAKIHKGVSLGTKATHNSKPLAWGSDRPEKGFSWFLHWEYFRAEPTDRGTAPPPRCPRPSDGGGQMVGRRAKDWRRHPRPQRGNPRRVRALQRRRRVGLGIAQPKHHTSNKLAHETE